MKVCGWGKEGRGEKELVLDLRFVVFLGYSVFFKVLNLKFLNIKIFNNFLKIVW